MLGEFHLLPLLKGWEYKIHSFPVTVIRGAAPQELPISETGWLIGFGVMADDCYAKMTLLYQGACLEAHEVGVSPYELFMYGAFQQDPNAYLLRYLRPNPNSSAGYYVLLGLTSGYQGAPFPYIPTIKLSCHLPVDSTQAQSVMGVTAQAIAIVDKKAFIRSLRAVWGIKDMKVDPALLTVGPAEPEGAR